MAFFSMLGIAHIKRRGKGGCGRNFVSLKMMAIVSMEVGLKLLLLLVFHRGRPINDTKLFL